MVSIARESKPPQAVESSEDLDRRPALRLESTGFCEAPERIERLIGTLERARGSKVCITIIGHPDPDSIASAMALKHIFSHFEIRSALLFFDQVSHPENRALINSIEAELQLYSDEFDLSEYDYLSFVDSQNPVLPIKTDKLPPILAFVDHHKSIGGFEAEFIDIREHAGATSSIFAEYFEHSTLRLENGSVTDSHIATALMHGIRTDTDNLLLASSIDFRAGAYLRNFTDLELLRVISKQSVTVRTMEVIQRGLNNKVIRGTFLLAGVGFVREEDRDGIAQTADFLLRYEGVETALVFGIVNGGAVDGSLRSTSATIDPDGWLKSVFGTDSTGKPFGGGRRGKGGFRIPLGLFARCHDRDALWSIGKKTIEDLVFEKIGVDSTDKPN